MESVPSPQQAVYVYQLPVRLWHWTIVAAIIVLVVTGYIIGKPWVSVTGEPYNTFYMGYTRLAHFIAGFILIIATVYRMVFALLGNSFSREIFIVPVWKASWRKNLWTDIRWYLFLNDKPEIYMGHNPLAQAGMSACVVFLLIMILSGLGMYAQGSSVPFFHFFSFMVDFMYWIGGNEQTLRSFHRLGMMLLLAFIIIHLYMVIREEIMGRTSLVSTMFSGFRHVRK
ncbi:MAG: Ni/Fe-hydrogenase, b-type cytochrome subunit [Desulfovibrionaceae bacterium]